MPAAPEPTLATPVPDPLLALADRCVQCGLCLPACPTYGREQLESESPRGRIALTRAWALESIAPTAIADTHLDHCLGCRSCEAVCPAGVEYGRLLVGARQRQRERRPPRWRQRLFEGLARRWNAAVEKHPRFERETHFAGAHATEWQVRIGPLASPTQASGDLS